MEFWPGEPAVHYTAGATSNPGGATVLADTGQVLKPGNYFAHIMASADAACVLLLQHRDSNNTTNVAATSMVEGQTMAQAGGTVSPSEQRIYLAANSNAMLFVPFTIFNANERIRIMPSTTVTANVSASILWQKMM